MKRSLVYFKSFVFILSATLALSGCLSATHPLPNRERVKGDSPLVGYWHGVVTNATQRSQLQFWSVFYFGGNHFSVVMSNKKAWPKEDFGAIRPDEDTSLFDVYTTTIGDDTYLTLKGIRGSDIRDYLIVKYVLDEDNLEIFNIRDESIKRGVEMKQLRARQDGVITSKSSDMAKWIETLSPFDFEPYATFQRSELDPRELTHRLLSLIPSEA